MWKAAKSVVGHERDHKTASIEQRLKYHENCSSHTNCTFWTHVNIDKLPPSDFVFNRKTANGDSVEGGILHLDIFDQYPQAYDDLVWKFYYDTNFLKEGVIAGMKYYVTSNANESIHQKIWNRLFKIKSHSLERTLFIFQKVLMINNFGYYRSSLYHVLGMMGPLATRMLKKKIKNHLDILKIYILPNLKDYKPNITKLLVMVMTKLMMIQKDMLLAWVTQCHLIIKKS